MNAREGIKTLALPRDQLLFAELKTMNAREGIKTCGTVPPLTGQIR